MTLALSTHRKSKDSIVPRKDKTVRYLVLFASVVSLASYIWFDHRHTTLFYRDASAHMEIARRVIDSPTTGYGQLGGVWLPLQHVLMLPFVWFDPFYYSGFAGSIISMTAFVVTSVLLYKIVFTLTGKKAGGIVAAFVFMSCGNVLYMQSTPMSELLLFACLTGMVYGMQRWIQTEHHGYLMGAAVAGFLGSLTRYEAWVLLLGMVLLVAFVSWRKKYEYSKSEGLTLAFVFVGSLGIVMWLGYNLLTFGNALNWQNGAYAKPSLWVHSEDIAVGNWSVALKTYWYATVDDLWMPIVALMILGLVVCVVRERLRVQTLPALSLLGMFPFFVYALEAGQRPLHVQQINGSLYNVRFGLLMILPAAILIGYLAAQVRFAWVAIGSVCAAVLVTVFSTDNFVTIKDPERTVSNGYFKSEAETALWMRKNYTGGAILSESFGNELLLFKAHISLKNNVYEGSYQLWDPALKDPAKAKIRWIIMRMKRGETDLVFDSLYDSAQLQSYHRVYQNADYYVYEVN